MRETKGYSRVVVIELTPVERDEVMDSLRFSKFSTLMASVTMLS
jgi:hypothetical protein